MVGAAESSPPASGRMALFSTPCSLAGLSAELLTCSPAPTVAVPGHGCPAWLAAWDSAGPALRIVTAARTIETLFIVNSICALFMNSLSVIALLVERTSSTRYFKQQLLICIV